MIIDALLKDSHLFSKASTFRQTGKIRAYLFSLYLEPYTMSEIMNKFSHKAAMSEELVEIHLKRLEHEK